MASVHHNTPHIVAVGSRGLPARSIEYLRSEASMPAVALISRQRHDTVGRPVEQWDPRLFGSAPKPNQTSRYTLAGALLYTNSVDAGWRLGLPGLAAQALQNWDERGSHWRTTYDQHVRPTTLEENGVVGIDTFAYGDATADPSHNLRGQLIQEADPSGALALHSYGLLGQPLRETRTFGDGMSFVSQRIFSPLGEVLEQTDAGAHRQRSGYDLTGQLVQVRLQLKDQTEWQPVLAHAQYNAAGQVVVQETGNDVATHLIYDERDGRLWRQHSQRRDGSLLLDFEYLYDPMGNVSDILDHAFTPSHFANQRVDGHRAFSYDSLYRLLSASGYDDGPPSDIPGLPQPTDPANRLNYTQTYQYDTGGNLIRLRHVRDGANYTREMSIDPASNRGVRWTPGSPAPSFDTLFDRHGNLQLLQPGQNMRWNARDQLASITLVERDTDANDEEFYHYSQGMRVYKRHETHTSTTRHFREVRYLPGLEIRTRDNGEELHVVTLPTSLGTVRCLHWEAGEPTGVEPDQLRFSLLDHLGSSLMELDQHAQPISHEGYYPFGATAWMKTRSTVQVSYKTVRYSAKEMDVSGMYHYGVRYYAPWLLRWISPDPFGNVDGLNRYSMVGNNPLSFVDEQGAMKQEPTNGQTFIDISPGLSRASSTSSQIAGNTRSPAPVDARNNPPPFAPKPDETWPAWANRITLAAVNSRVGLALLPVGTSSPANAVIISTLLTAATQLTVHATLFNPGWSPPGTWDPSDNGALPPVDVTQNIQRMFSMTTLAISTAAVLAGAILGPVAGGYVDELRGTKDKAEKKAQAGKLMDIIDELIAGQRVLEDVTEKAQNSLREQVLEVEAMIGITWRTMGMLEKITKLRSGSDSSNGALSRQSLRKPHGSTGLQLMKRTAAGRTPVRKSNLR